MSCSVLYKICSICNKKIKQDNGDNLDNCQGHNIFSVKNGIVTANKNRNTDDYSQLAHRIFKEEFNKEQ